MNQSKIKKKNLYVQRANLEFLAYFPLGTLKPPAGAVNPVESV